MERHTGEPCAEKVASTARREAVGKVPKGNSLAANSTMERTAKPGEGQNDGQETAAIHGGLQVSTIAHPQKSTSCSDRDRPPVPDQNTTHPSGCTLFFPFRGLVIGANHIPPTRWVVKECVDSCWFVSRPSIQSYDWTTQGGNATRQRKRDVEFLFIASDLF